jgi:hypothetical protein
VSKRTLINDRYELDDLPIARGGMGDVWGGRDIRLDRPVAVKLIRSHDGVSEQDYVRRFVRESRITARLQHPGVPAVYDAGTHAGRPYLVMQRVYGLSLSDLIAEQGQLPIAWAAGIAAQICAVLAAAHRASLVHRDLKPSNVMIERDGGIKVLDFGLAVAPTLPDFSKITQSGQPIGTPAYMAPEQVLAGISGPRTDLYALGCTLHEMVTGEPLFAGSTSYSLMSKQVSEPPPPLRGRRPDVPAQLDRLVLELLEKTPEDRPASAEIVYRRLLPLVGDLQPLPGILDHRSRPSPVRMYARVLGQVLAGATQTTTADSAATRPEPGPVGRDDVDRARREAADLVSESRYGQAAEVLAAATEPASHAFGGTDADVLSLRLDLANARFEAGDYRGAAPDYQRLAIDLAERDGPDTELVLHCRQREATCHALIGDTSRALRQLGDLLVDESRVFGPDDPRTVELRRQTALLQLGAGQRDAARQTLGRLLADLTRINGPADPGVVEVQRLIARLD